MTSTPGHQDPRQPFVPGSHRAGPQPQFHSTVPLPRGPNPLGVAAFAAASLGLAVTMWRVLPPIVGLILLTIAIALSLVALFQKGKSKKHAGAALTLSILGGLVAVVVLTVS
ncbi:hypothetical protein [Tessaracoccus antarcticus]|uniref:Uncharacterized protein n=1 Tax=Tessaracoccus antarcticus TaxID=2479848 RepID=A0A3M0G8I8_9ACTN|nr:hypothetical protein [Tessaracoccus antarcticus]RMB61340.1 hypothetical protein EAX62_01370 [Tessaracoccus antarcticus]